MAQIQIPDMLNARNFTDADIEALAVALSRAQRHVCRYENISEEDMEAAIRFHQHINALMSETGSTIRKTVIVAGVTGLIALLILGIYSKLKTELGIN